MWLKWKAKTRVNYSANSISLRYVAKEDRIQWICHCNENKLVVVWITRHMLTILLPRLAKWLDQNNPQEKQLVKTRTESEQKHISRFEHEIAQKQVSSTRAKLALTNVVDQFLMQTFGLKTEGSKVAVNLTGEGDSQSVVFQATLSELHKIVGELIQIGEKAGWHIEHPWYSLAPDPGAAVDLSVH